MTDWIGYRIHNSDQINFVRKKGTPVHVRPDGPDHQVIYYPERGPSYPDQVKREELLEKAKVVNGSEAEAAQPAEAEEDLSEEKEVLQGLLDQLNEKDQRIAELEAHLQGIEAVAEEATDAEASEETKEESSETETVSEETSETEEEAEVLTDETIEAMLSHTRGGYYDLIQDGEKIATDLGRGKSDAIEQARKLLHG